jgi:hypothetical protein
MSKFIFFDLETTDLNFTGQILQFSFVETSSEYPYDIKDRLDGTIALSRIQLPNPDAIVATNIDIKDHLDLLEEHQETNGRLFLKNFNERDSLNMIKEWIDEKCSRDKVFLIGHNSTNFDVPYLRTSMIRNGINPYFNKNLDYIDTKNVLKRWYCEDPSFSQLLHEKGNLSRPFSLENISKILNILTDSQTHQAWDDVDLLIDMCRNLKMNYICDIDNSSYSIDTYSSIDKIDVKNYIDFEYKKLSNDSVELIGLSQKPVVIYDNFSSGKYYFFLDIEKALESYHENKKYTIEDARNILIWKKTSGSFCLVRKAPDMDNKEAETKIRDIISKLRKLNISMENYFEKKICDIEQHIYMMDYNGMNQLITAIDELDSHGKIFSTPTDLYARKLLTRYKLNNLKNIGDENFQSILHMYLDYRYGRGSLFSDTVGCRMIVDRFAVDMSGVDENTFHPMLKDYQIKLQNLLTKYSKDNEKMKILNSLLNYYNDFTYKYNFEF